MSPPRSGRRGAASSSSPARSRSSRRGASAVSQRPARSRRWTKPPNAEWLWEEHLGNATPAEIFREIYESIPADDPFWQVVVADPGVEDLFGDPEYVRGAMTLQALRERVGDDAFWAIVRSWHASKSGGNGTTPDFIALAEQISGQQLDDVFDPWLFTAGRPELPAAEAARARATTPDATWLNEVRQRLAVGRY